MEDVLKRSQLKRTGFKPRELPLNSSRPDSPSRTLKTSPAVSAAQRKPLNKLGRRGKGWRKVWNWLKPRLKAAHRTECEFDFIPHSCFGLLDPAHSKKRSKMQGNDIYAVAIACRNIHRVLDEVYTHAAMEKAVMTAIERGGGLILPK